MPEKHYTPHVHAEALSSAVEQASYTRLVAGSIPAGPTNNSDPDDGPFLFASRAAAEYSFFTMPFEKGPKPEQPPADELREQMEQAIEWQDSHTPVWFRRSTGEWRQGNIMKLNMTDRTAGIVFEDPKWPGKISNKEVSIADLIRWQNEKEEEG